MTAVVLTAAVSNLLGLVVCALLLGFVHLAMLPPEAKETSR